MQYIKKAVSIIIGFISIHFGWVGWLFLLYAFAMIIDFITGSALALKKGAWASKTAREKLWKKCGSLIAILVSGLVDLLLQLLITNVPGYELPFSYSTLFLPTVIVWYLLAEFGSIIENASAMGAPVPHFLKKSIDALNKTIEISSTQKNEHR